MSELIPYHNSRGNTGETWARRTRPLPPNVREQVSDLYNAYRIIHTDESDPLWILRCIAQIARCLRQQYGIAHTDIDAFYSVFEVLVEEGVFEEFLGGPLITLPSGLRIPSRLYTCIISVWDKLREHDLGEMRLAFQGWCQVLAHFETRLTVRLLFEILVHAGRVTDESVTAADEPVFRETYQWIIHFCDWLARENDGQPTLATSPAARFIISGFARSTEAHEYMTPAETGNEISNVAFGEPTPRYELVQRYAEQGRLNQLPRGYVPPIALISMFQQGREQRHGRRTIGQRTFINGFDVSRNLIRGSLTSTSSATSDLISDPPTVRFANEEIAQGEIGPEIGISSSTARDLRRPFSTRTGSNRSEASFHPLSTVTQRQTGPRSTRGFIEFGGSTGTRTTVSNNSSHESRRNRVSEEQIEEGDDNEGSLNT